MIDEPGNREVSLQEAVQIFKAEKGAPINSYDWYRTDAKRFGKVFIGGELPAHRVGRRWFVWSDDLEAAIGAHRARLKRRTEITDDYRRRVVHGKKGETIHTDFGGYHVWEPFHFVWNDYEVGRHKSNGSWRCTVCWDYVRVDDSGNGVCQGCGKSDPVGPWRS